MTMHPTSSSPHASVLPRRTVRVLDSAMSYIDSDGSGPAIVFLHGNPTSSYLWRNILPYLTDHGRCLAPDLIGMGQSGPAPAGQYRFVDHARYLDAWFEALQLDDDIILVVHDWGSALGFDWARRHPQRIRAIAYMEALVQTRRWEDFPNGRDAIFRALRSDKGEPLIFEENFFVETVLPKSILRQLSNDEMEAYRAPFKHRDSRLPTLTWARELPIDGEPADVARIVDAYAQWMAVNDIPKLLISAQPGALLAGRALEFCRSWRNQREITVPGIHYIQEDSPHEIGAALRAFVAALR